jgi:hypothetical protein
MSALQTPLQTPIKSLQTPFRRPLHTLPHTPCRRKGPSETALRLKNQVAEEIKMAPPLFKRSGPAIGRVNGRRPS